jgi:DHA1 family quinolone resistance protein-like MFS transporter
MNPAGPMNRRALLIYVLPATVDLVLSLLLFVGTVRAAQMGGGALQAAAVLTTFSLVYVVSCPLVGRIVTPANASRLTLAGVVLLAVVCGLLAFTAAFVPMLVLVGASGIAAALFFPPFQTFMKDVDSVGGRSVAWSTGIYTFSWSLGYACGPLVSGFLMQRVGGWRLAFSLGAFLCVMLASVLLTVNRHRASAASGTAPAAAGDQAYTALPDLAWLAWTVSASGFLAIAVVRSIFPALALDSLHFTEGKVGTIFFVLSAAQALVGLALARSRTWMYRALPVAAMSLAGVVGILCFGVGRDPRLIMAGAVLFGGASGGFYFFVVFHALVHPSRAGIYVAINESVVGISGVLAPLAAGAAADAMGYKVPFVAAAALMIVVMVVPAVTLPRRSAGRLARQESAGRSR